jgi:CheY-like chemotaxis protein
MLGVEVQIAHDGAEAIRTVDEWPPTHVLMDLGMPGMDGYEAARRLRARHADHAFRLIAMTGWRQEEDRLRKHQHDPIRGDGWRPKPGSQWERIGVCSSAYSGRVQRGFGIDIPRLRRLIQSHCLY